MTRRNGSLASRARWCNEQVTAHRPYQDEPFRVLDDATDSLDHRRIANRLISLLDDLRSGGADTASTVVGLVGPWGSGKTTIFNDVTSRLTGWEVRRLESWLATDAAQLATEVYASITSAIPRDAKWKRTRALARGFFEAATPLVGVLSPTAATLTKAMTARYSRKESPTELHRRLAEALVDLPRPILLVIDDVDRLQPVELRELLRALRVVGRLPRVCYLLAYDERSLVDALQETAVARTEDRARDFMQKIVQVRIDIPPLLPTQGRQLLLDALGANAEFGLTEDELVRLDLRWEVALHAVVTTPRHIALIASQLAATWRDVAGEVDPVDFLTVTLCVSSNTGCTWRWRRIGRHSPEARRRGTSSRSGQRT